MKPKLDYYVGRPVEAVTVGDEPWDWAIRFSGDVILRNTDKRRTAGPQQDLIGQQYFTAILSETDTVLQFGHYEDQQPVVDTSLTLTPTHYTITDERFEGGPHFPQVPDQEEESLLPDDPSSERVASGPVSPPQATEGEE